MFSANGTHFAFLDRREENAENAGEKKAHFFIVALFCTFSCCRHQKNLFESRVLPGKILHISKQLHVLPGIREG
jgi:hypothetical protein